MSRIPHVNNQYLVNLQNSSKQNSQALGNTLHSGKLKAAKQAFSKLQTDTQGINRTNGKQQQRKKNRISTKQQGQGHHQHNHHQTDSTTAATDQASCTGDGTTSTLGNTIDVTV
jgi:hypothetical protein